MAHHPFKDSTGQQLNRIVLLVIVVFQYLAFSEFVKPHPPVPKDYAPSQRMGELVGESCLEEDTAFGKAQCAHYCFVLIEQEDYAIQCGLGVYKVFQKGEDNDSRESNSCVAGIDPNTGGTCEGQNYEVPVTD